MFSVWVAVKGTDEAVKQIGKSVTGIQGDVSKLMILIGCMIKSRNKKEDRYPVR